MQDRCDDAENQVRVLDASSAGRARRQLDDLRVLPRASRLRHRRNRLYRQLDRFEEVLQRIRANYVDKPDDAKLIEGAINGMLSELDPHSFYMNAQEFRDLRVEESGRFGGVGLEVTMEDGSLKIVAPIEGSPAAKAGILPGDLITAIDGDDTKGMTLDDAVQRMRGPVKGPVTLSISRSGGSDSFDVRLVREVIQVVPVKYEIDSDVGYIRISSFNDQTAAELKQAIDAIEKAAGPSSRATSLTFAMIPVACLSRPCWLRTPFSTKAASCRSEAAIRARRISTRRSMETSPMGPSSWS